MTDPKQELRRQLRVVRRNPNLIATSSCSKPASSKSPTIWTSPLSANSIANERSYAGSSTEI